MNHRAMCRHGVVVLLLLGVCSTGALGLDAGTQVAAEVPEAVLVARSVADLALVCSGRMGLSYAINGVTGRWQISTTSGGDQWPVRLRGDSPTATSVAPMGDILRALADADSSGSASLAEIGRLHRLLSFGYIREHFRGPTGYDLDGLMVATGLDSVTLGAEQAEYSDLVSQAEELGLAWPGGR